MAVHGIPRSTLDIDIYIAARAEALNKLFKATGALRFRSEQKDIISVAHSPKLFANQWLCFSYKGQDVLDVFLAGEDEFNKLFKNSELRQDKNISIRVASLKDIIALKKASGRSVDLADIELIKEAKKI